MARPTARLVFALRQTAARLRQGTTYKWSNFGMCNCGNLAQTITGLDADTIHEAAYTQSGDWGQQGREYCRTSGLPIARVVREMLDAGLEPTDFEYVERLTHPHVLKRLPEGEALKHTSREDTIRFMELWADILVEKLTDTGREEVVRLTASLGETQASQLANPSGAKRKSERDAA